MGNIDLNELVLGAVFENGGIKTADLIQQEATNSVTRKVKMPDVIATIEKLVKDRMLIRLEYVLPGSGSISSFLIPNGTKHITLHNYDQKKDFFPTEKARARTTDPATSHEAKKLVDPGRLERLCLDMLIEYGPLTTFEISAMSGVILQSITPRMVGLESKGLAMRLDRKPINGVTREVWAATEKAIEKYKRRDDGDGTSIP